MKLETTLDDSPPTLFFASVIDVILILLVFFLLGSSLVVRSGMAVRLPASSSGIQDFVDSHVVTISAGAEGKMFLDGNAVGLAELESELASLDPRKPSIVMRVDQLATHGLVIEVSDIILRRGFDLAYATSSIGAGAEEEAGDDG